MLTAKNLSKIVAINGSKQHILQDISLDIHSQDFISITGRSGSGKTTLLHLLSTLSRPDGGELHYKKQDLSKLPERRLNTIRQTDFAIIFQFHHLLPYLTALENCLLPFMDSAMPVARKTMDKAKDCLDRVGLADKVHMLPGKLSGGEQQRVAIARALVKSSQVLFADEPTGSLDKKTGEQIMDLLSSLHADGLTIVMVTHEPTYASRGTRTIALEDGALA